MQNNQPFKGMLMVSDIDGTIMTNKFTVPERNIEAVKRFKAKGGLFTLATGRTISSAGRYVGKIPINAPTINYNGSAIYDYERQEFIWKAELPYQCRVIIQAVLDNFPDVGAEVFNGDNIFVLRNNDYTMLHYSEEKVEFKPSTLETAPQPWMKALFTCNHPRLREVEQFVKSLSYEGFYFVFSGERYFEILPTNVTKGTSLKRLADFLKIKHNNTVAIGDFYNDLNLIQLAGIGAAVKEAPDDVKAVADIVVGSCEGGAVADLIEYLEDKYK